MRRDAESESRRAIQPAYAFLGNPENISRLLLWAAVALAVGVHVTILFHRGGLWRDEVSTLNIASHRTLSEMLEGLKFNTLPIAVPLALFTAGKVFGPSAATDSVAITVFFCIGIATPLLWAAFSNRVRRLDPFVLVLLQGANVTIAQWGDTVRAYGLGVLSLNLLFFSLLRFEFKDDRASRCMVLGSFLLAIHACYQGWPLSAILMLACAAIIFFCSASPGRLWSIAFLFCVLLFGGITAIPYLGVLAKTAEVHKILQTPELSAFGVLSRFIEIMWQSGGAFIAASLVALGGGAWIFCRLPPKPDRGTRDENLRSSTGRFAITIAAAAAICGLMVYCWQITLAAYVPYPWHFVLLLSFLTFPLSFALPIAVPLLLHRNLVAAVLLVIAVAQLPRTFPNLEKGFTNVPRIAGYLQNEADAGDMLLVTPWEWGISMAHHYKDEGRTAWQTVPTISDNSTNRFDLAAAWMSKPKFSGLTDQQQSQIAEVLENGRSVWVIGQLSIANDGRELLILPPAPTPQWGWRNGPYYEVWSRNLHTVLARSATHAAVIEEAMGRPGDYQPYEYAGLYKFWRDASESAR
jgi:hypothetical protein